MITAIASGKGGTGKTSISVAYAQSYPAPVTFLDCDVEEPNAHFFIQPEIEFKDDVNVPVPLIDSELCTACGVCSEVCQFNAIVQIRQKVTIFSELCHSCGGCMLFCPNKAIAELPSGIGTIETGRKEHISFIKGELMIGASMSPPLIRHIKQASGSAENIVIDCPPGTACPMVTAVKGADYVVLVTEPTPFGLNDLKIAVETLRQMSVPFGVIINRSDGDDSIIERYCLNENIEILMKIEEDRAIAEAYSVGKSMLEVNPEMVDRLRAVITRIEKTVGYNVL